MFNYIQITRADIMFKEIYINYRLIMQLQIQFKWNVVLFYNIAELKA